MKKIYILILLLYSSNLFAQESADTTYNIEVFISCSPTISFFNKPKYPTDADKYSLGGSIFLRGMWHPGRMLSLGFMTGYVMLAKDEFKEYPTISGKIPTATLYAIPLQLAVTMQRLDTEIGLGIGPYWMSTSLDDGFGSKTYGNRIEFGITFWGSYGFPLHEELVIAPEFKFLYLGNRGITSLMPSVSLKYFFYRY